MITIFKNKNIVIAGAGGIGSETAKLIIKQGGRVILLDNNENALNMVHESLMADAPDKTISKTCLDITSESEIKVNIKRILAEYSHIDGLIYAVGISPKKDKQKISVEDIELEQWNKVLDVNLTGAFLLIKYLVPHMKLRRKGVITLISSLAGRTYSPTAGLHYISSKAGLLGLTKGLAHELSPYKIRVNSVSPSKVNTEMMQTSSGTDNQKYLEEIPIGRFAKASEVAETLLFLTSDKSSYLTGTNIDINGGKLMV